ncbi:Spo0B domain-containing protein [Nocardioides sp. KIGAM211]|uniref:histidine kinase n=1 Tax=Nocardioides luti TaxID=2761101 RepID=A0A7X0RJR5_9ACTN|nr:ATP-binding protein [Nocardioides luti]MBB6629601.1 Spo0B domain-containing protein [Nocardioides luti]
MRPGRSRARVSLAGQFLVLQLVVLLLALAVTSVVSVRQSDAEFSDTRGARLRAGAENLAGNPAVRTLLAEDRVPASLAYYPAQTQRTYVASSVYVARADGTVVAGTGPAPVGGALDLSSSDVRQGRSWTGDVDDDGRRSIAAQVPVISNQGRVVGIVMVAEAYPSLGQRLVAAAPDLLSFLGLGLALGVAGSWLLARLIKRRTRGLEPAEIGALADQREALLHSIREGVVAVGNDGAVTVMSDSACELLGLPEGTAEGRQLAALPLADSVRDVLLDDSDVRDAVLMVAGRVIVLNRNRVLHEGRQVGTVATLRDRTELLAMQSELAARESVTRTLRAQTHEFSNQLHTISGLLQLEEYDEASRVIGALSRRRAEISRQVTDHVDDPSVAALLIAKVSLAAERGIGLVLDDLSALPRLEHELSADVGTVLGNLVDNAVDATVDAGGSRVVVRLSRDGDVVLVQVADTGAGVPEDAAVFERGYTTKPGDASGRGVGLALVQLVCERRSGSVSVHNDGGAVFTARLPQRPGPA